jgi:energy-coupling factor transporter transmembrane protein EcfT
MGGCHPFPEIRPSALIVCWRLLLVVSMGVLLMATTRTADIRAALVWYLKPIPVVDEKMAATMVGLVVRFLPVILFQAS